MASHSEDSVADKDKWVQEAQAVMTDIEHHVRSVAISNTLPSTNRMIFLNLRTLEDKDYCIEVSVDGFQIVGEKFDDNSGPTEIFYETPYSLLNSISPQFKESFGNELISKLSSLASEEQ